MYKIIIYKLRNGPALRASLLDINVQLNHMISQFEVG